MKRNEIIDWVKERLLGDREISDKSQIITHNQLEKCIYNFFCKSLDSETTDEGLLFHTSFYIYLNELDYFAREQAFAYTVRDVIKKIDRKIKKMRKKYPDYRPHSQYWQFQFVSFNGGAIKDALDEYVDKIEIGKPLIISFIHPELIGQSNRGDGRVVATAHIKDSVSINKWAINRNALQGIDISGKDRFRVPFRDSTPERIMPVSEAYRAGTERIAKAILKVSQCRFLVDGMPESSIYMNHDYLQISGRNDVDNRGGMAVVRLDSDEILNPHLTIRFDGEKKRFAISAIGDVVLNERPLPMDANVWTPLPHQSSILLNGEIQISFEIYK